MKTKLIYLFIPLIAFFTGCTSVDNYQLTQNGEASSYATKQKVAVPVTLLNDVAICGIASSYDLIAGQHDTVGFITIYNDSQNLYVDYVLTNGGTLGTVHLWVGTDLTLVPATPKGIPIPGQFTYQYDTNGASSYSFVIPLANIASLNDACGETIYAFAHAEVSMPDGPIETAWGGNHPVDVDSPGRWYFYADYTVQCCDEPPVVLDGTYETAFAKGGWVFTTNKKSNPEKLPSLNLTNNRWGWAINVKTDGVTTYDIYAGAGLNDITKGKKVGTLSVEKNGSNITVSYNFSSGYLFEEVHIYMGDSKPTTLAPGQYGWTEYFDPMSASYSHTFTVSDTDGDGIWIIAHSVAYGAF